MVKKLDWMSDDREIKFSTKCNASLGDNNIASLVSRN